MLVIKKNCIQMLYPEYATVFFSLQHDTNSKISLSVIFYLSWKFLIIAFKLISLLVSKIPIYLLICQLKFLNLQAYFAN